MSACALRAYRQRLEAVRAADAEHEAEMRRLLDGSGVTLKRLRALSMRDKDRVFSAILSSKARAAE